MRGASSRSLVGRQRKCISCVCGALRRVQGAQPESEQMRKFSYPAVILLLVSFSFSMSPVPMRAGAEQHLLYVASPGVRNYVEYGGVGVLVFDVDKGYKFVRRDRKSTRLNSSHGYISYAVFCLKKKNNKHLRHRNPLWRS